ncbi:MAG: AAA family ATPase [bacterium]|nr:AAA family ATPase [bacterium]
MVLSKVRIGNFLSVREPITIDIDKKVTILLGSNDHGKTNILAALRHLNDAFPIEAEEVNWDANKEDQQPTIEFVFELSDEETAEFEALSREEVVEEHASANEEVSGPTNADKPTMGDGAAGVAEDAADAQAVDEGQRESRVPEDEEAVHIAAGRQLVFSRQGVGKPLLVDGLPVEELSAAKQGFLKRRKPKVELFNVTGKLHDSVTFAKLSDEEFEFMEGILYQAGLSTSSKSLFTLDDVTRRQLSEASEVLTQRLRELWEQGRNLEFILDHGAGETIELLVKDPAVQTRFVRLSKRSTGVTQFFQLSMILLARRTKNPSGSYIYLFDDPGIHLHSKGQNDLMQVFERIADDSQIVYATHSLFLLNQNYPERHRLILKDGEGTKVDQKPHQGNWRRATDALGVTLQSNILFSSKLLFVEGDSDPMYLYELFRQLNRLDHLDVDLNYLGVKSFYDEQNLRTLLQFFKGKEEEPRVVLLVDGDSSGKKILSKAKELCDRLRVQVMELRAGRSIEDYCLYPEQFLQAVVSALREVLGSRNLSVPDELEAEVRHEWEAHRLHPPLTTGRWFETIARRWVRGGVSKVWLAREYAIRAREVVGTTAPENLEDAVHLCQSIAEKLDLPQTRAKSVLLAAE